MTEPTTFTEEEQLGMAQIIDGTIDSMMQDIDFDHEDFAFWIVVLRKLGEPAKVYLDAWIKAAAEEGVIL